MKHLIFLLLPLQLFAQFTEKGISLKPVEILSTELNEDFIGFKLHPTEEPHKFFLEFRGIRAAKPESVTQALKQEFLDTRSLHLIYTMEPQYKRGVYIIFSNNITYREMLAKVKAAIRKHFFEDFEEAVDSIGFLIPIQKMLDVAYGRYS